MTGPWREGVTVNMTDGATGSTILIGTTGNYSFTVASGASYTLSASLPGYTFSTQTVSVAAGSAAAVTVPAILGAPVIAFTTISGTVTYAGAKDGPVIVSVASENSRNVIQWKTRILLTDGSGLYTIRGVPIGGYIVNARMAASGTGEPNASDPVAPQLTAFTTVGNATEINLVLADPATVTPVVPTLISVTAGSAAAFVLFTTPANGNQELATAYKIYWSMNADATTGGSSAIFPATGTFNGGFALVKGLTDGNALYFKINALVGGIESATSAVTSSPVTIGAVAGGNTVSGTVDTSGLGEVTTGTRMIVGLYNQTTRATYFSTDTPAASVNYSITGVPTGTYYNFAIIDMNGNGVVDTGDISNIKDGTAVTVVAGTNTANLKLSSAPTVSIATYYRAHGTIYNLIVKPSDGAKRVVGVTLYAGHNVAVPRDMAASPGNDGFIYLQTNAVGNAATPQVGDAYGFKVFFSDGTSKLMSSSVTGVLGANVPTGLATSQTAAGATVAAPQFSWAAPAVTPTALPYVYNLGLQPTIGSGTTWWMENMPSSQLSVLYNANANASGAALNKDANTWFVQVKDANGNIGQSLNAPY